MRESELETGRKPRGPAFSSAMGGGASAPVAARPDTNSISFGEGDAETRNILERIAALPQQQAHDILGRASALVQSLLPPDDKNVAAGENGAYACSYSFLPGTGLLSLSFSWSVIYLCRYAFVVVIHTL